MTAQVSILEIHAANSCNLTCESCSHFSNGGHKGVLDLGEAEAWMRSWKERVVPTLFRILGGEPTLNPRLTELIEMSAAFWPRSRIALTTNGFFLQRHPSLPAVLSKHNVLVRFTIHHDSEEYRRKVDEITSLLDGWRQDYPFELIVEQAHQRWTRRYRGIGAEVLPFEHDRPRQSWETCSAKKCMQLFRNRLWKCPTIAYLRLQKEAYPGMSGCWDRYLAYEGLAPDCSDAELAAFAGRQEEAICGMCPSQAEPFAKPSPLIPLSTLRARP